jgi:putative oxidoreductase
MALEMSALEPFEPRLRSVVRIVVGFTFSLHGWQKLFGAFGGLGGHKPSLSSMLGAAGVIETVGGALIILGLFTTPVAFLLAGEMAVGYFRTHAPRGIWPLTNGGELAVFYCFFYIWLSAAGAGPWSLDHVLRKRTSAAVP